MESNWVGLSEDEENALWESTVSDWELMKRTEEFLREKNARKDMPAAEDKAGYDWSLLEATQESLREHMAIVKELQQRLAKYEAGGEPVKFLANGTRFKMSFFQNEDGQGNHTDGTHVTCFEAFEDELDGRWVALVPAEDSCHLKLTRPQPQ